MGGKYPTAYRRAAYGHLGFQRGTGSSERASGLASESAREAMRIRNENRMMDLARQVGELDRRAGPVKQPLPLQQRPAWAQREAMQRMANNPHWGRALAIAERNAVKLALSGALRAALMISPLGRIMNALDILRLGLDGMEWLKQGIDSPAVPAGFNMAGWTQVRLCAGVTANYMDNATAPPGCSTSYNWKFVGAGNKNATQSNTMAGNESRVSLYEVRWDIELTPGSNNFSSKTHSVWDRQPGTTGLPQYSPGAAARTGVVLDYNPDPLFENSPTVATEVEPSSRRPPPFHYRVKPPKNVLERKGLTQGSGIQLVKRVVNAVTESLDVFNCAYDALPDDVTGYQRKPLYVKPIKGHRNTTHVVPWIDLGGGEHVKKPFRRTHNKMKVFLKNYDKMDLNQFIECAIKNHFEDKIIGTLASKAGPFGGKYGRPIGFTAGPAL